MFAVVVSFQIKTERIEDFMPLMLANAATSLAQEDGCHRFDVCTDPARVGDVFLYELYTDAAAFELHLASDHFKSFDAAVASMIADKTIRTYGQVAS